RDGRALLEAHARGHREELRRGHRDRLGVAAEARERDDALAGDEGAVGAGTEALDRARDLVADHARARRRVRVEAEARHHVGEVDAAGTYADERLAGAGDRVRAVADLERLGRPGARDPDRAHAGRELARAAPGRQTPGVAAAFRTRVAARPDGRDDERRGAAGRHRPQRPRAGAPAGAAVPAAGVRRAGVHCAQRVAALRRLVRRQSGPPEARARRRPGPAELARLAGGAGRLADRAAALPPRATSRSPASSRSWPPRPPPGTPPSVPCAARSTASGPTGSAPRWRRASTAGRRASAGTEGEAARSGGRAC